MHFTKMTDNMDVPVITRGEGAWVYDERGKRYLDGLAGLFVSQVGHGRAELAERGRQAGERARVLPRLELRTPGAIELAERLADLSPGDLNRTFFTTGGSEAVESAWKLARQYFRAKGEADRTKSSAGRSRTTARQWARSRSRACPRSRRPYEPLVNGAIKVPNTNSYRPAPIDPAEAIAQAIEIEGPETVAAVFLEPVQNAGGCFPPTDGYFQRVREICDDTGVLLVSDEVICAFGRLGHWFGSQRYDYQPDIITMAKGLTSGYSPIGGMIGAAAPRRAVPARRAHLPARHHVRRASGELRGRARQPRRHRE